MCNNLSYMFAFYFIECINYCVQIERLRGQGALLTTTAANIRLSLFTRRLAHRYAADHILESLLI